MCLKVSAWASGTSTTEYFSAGAPSSPMTGDCHSTPPLNPGIGDLGLMYVRTDRINNRSDHRSSPPAIMTSKSIWSVHIEQFDEPDEFHWPKRLSQSIGYYSACWSVDEVNSTRLNFVTNIVVLYINMFRPLVQNWIVSEGD
jgi:hypothetical protein